jgi:hypothetical protein
MFKRRRIEHAVSLKDRLNLFAKEAREKAAKLPPSAEKHDLLKKARCADLALHLENWVNSPGLQPPK